MRECRGGLRVPRRRERRRSESAWHSVRHNESRRRRSPSRCLGASSLQGTGSACRTNVQERRRGNADLRRPCRTAAVTGCRAPSSLRRVASLSRLLPTASGLPYHAVGQPRASDAHLATPERCESLAYTRRASALMATADLTNNLPVIFPAFRRIPLERLSPYNTWLVWGGARPSRMESCRVGAHCCDVPARATYRRCSAPLGAAGRALPRSTSTLLIG